MSEYYGVTTPSSDFFMHYGVKGMKWGVRRALARGDKAALKKNYIKASRKLAKLAMRSNREIMSNNYRVAKNRMINGAIGSAGMSGALGAGINAKHGFKAAAIYGGASALAGGIAGALANSKGITSRRYLSDKGHKKAVQKMHEWQKDMRDAFKGTEYKRGSLADHVNDALMKGVSSSKGHSTVIRIGNIGNKKRKTNLPTGKRESPKADSRALSTIASKKVKPVSYRNRR